MHCFGSAFGACLRHIDAVAPVMLGVTANLPAIDPVRGPSAALSGGFEDEEFRAWRCKRGPIEVEGVI